MKTIVGFKIGICMISYLLISYPQIYAQTDVPIQGIVTRVPQLPQVEVFLVGKAQLNNGTAEIQFDEKYSRLIPENNINVIITSMGSWSGIYIIELTVKGFKVKSESGNKNANFSWILVGERKKMQTGVYDR